ncbi:MAG: GumC family protein, partial [Lysobacterales bacterium]
RKLILAITIFVGIIGFIQANEIKNIYSATATLMVGLPETQVVDIEAVLSRNSAPNGAEDEVEVLRSRMLAAKVIRRLKLLSNPEFNPALAKPEESLFDFMDYLDPRSWVPDSWKKALKEALGMETEHAPPPVTSPRQKEEDQQHRRLSTATTIFLNKLKVQQVGFGNVINIIFSSLDPKMAAGIANDIGEAYIVDQLEAKFEATEKANAWLTEQLSGLEAKVVESERAVEIYRDQYGLADSSGLSLLDAQLSELNSQLIVARANVAEVEARLAQLQRLLQGASQGVETAAEVMASSLVQQLRTQEAQALSRASELSVEYGPKHPRMLQVKAEIVEIRERIRSEVERIATGLVHEVEFARTKVASLEGS